MPYPHSQRRRVARSRPRAIAGAVTLAALLLSATAVQAQRFPWPPAPLPWPGQYFAPPPWPGPGYVPPQEGGQPYPYAPPGPTAGSRFDAPARPAPRPRAALAAAPGAVQADLDAEALQLQAADPPAVVGRVARAQGGVSLRLPEGEDWRPASANTAIVAGSALWTDPGARAAIEAGQSLLALEGGTALQVDALDEQGLRATLAQGSVFLRLNGLDGTVDIATPEASLATAIDGRILIEAAAPDGSRPGRIAVFEGAAEVTLANSTETRHLGPGEALRLAPGAPPIIEAAGPPTPLMAWALGAEPRAPIPSLARGMTGIGELGLAGRWDRHAEFGDVWYPPVQQDWVPYSDGSWEWREPWGWTWVDAAPWGFATSHYGRWVRLGPRWGWAPAPVQLRGLPPLRPVWAPALVTFFATPGFTTASGFGRPVGWIPLGPREAWYPWYRASPAYVARVNSRQVTHLAPLRERWTAWGGPDRRWDARGEPDGRWDPRGGGNRRDGAAPPWVADRRLDAYRNRAAATLVPERTMRDSLPVRAEARRAGPAELRRAEAPNGLLLRPAAETRGLSARAAERFGVPPDAVRAARPERDAAPPASVRAAMPPPVVALPGLRARTGPERPLLDEAAPPRRQADPGQRAPIEAGPRGPDLRQRLQDEQARRRQEDPQPRRAEETSPARTQRQQELRQRLLEADPGRRAQETRRATEDQTRRQQLGGSRASPGEQSRDQQREWQRQQFEGARRQQEQRQQELLLLEDAGRRQQEQQRQQFEGARRQQEDAGRRQQQEQQRQQVEGARRQQADAQRQQMEQARRQQQESQRQQMDQSRRQQQDAQRQQQTQRQQTQQQRREERQR